MNGPAKQWRVKVGLEECTVSCATPEEAVRKARAALRDRMPRFDLTIQNLDAEEFHVYPLTASDLPVL